MRVHVILVPLALALAGCTTDAISGPREVSETFELAKKGTIGAVHSIEFKVRLKGDLEVRAESEPHPVLVVLQKKEKCGSFADDHYIPTSRYELSDISFSYYVDEPGEYCLSFDNRNGAPINVNATITLPR